MSVPRSIMGFFVQFFFFFSMSGNLPLISTHLAELGFSPAFIGFGVVLVSIIFGFMIPISIKFTEKISKRGCILIGLVLMSIGISVMGIDNQGKWRLTAIFSILGLTIFGSSIALVAIPLMPEILESIEERFGGQYNELVMQNNISGYFIFW